MQLPVFSHIFMTVCTCMHWKKLLFYEARLKKALSSYAARIANYFALNIISLLLSFQQQLKSLAWFSVGICTSRVIYYMTCYNFECSPWWKMYSKKNPLQDLLFSLNAVISTNESTRIITGHVIYNLAYTYKFQLKTT